MNNLSDAKTTNVHMPVSTASLSLNLLKFLNWLLVISALLTGIFLLLGDIFSFPLPHAPISASPLLLIGAAYLAFQLVTRPTLLELGKALIVSSAFILWGIDQILSPGWFATTLGDVVIVLYVIDLSWLMIDRLKQKFQEKAKESEL